MAAAEVLGAKDGFVISENEANASLQTYSLFAVSLRKGATNFRLVGLDCARSGAYLVAGLALI